MLAILLSPISDVLTVLAYFALTAAAREIGLFLSADGRKRSISENLVKIDLDGSLRQKFGNRHGYRIARFAAIRIDRHVSLAGNTGHRDLAAGLAKCLRHQN